MKTLALFDFDGTLYNKDSLLEFTKFYKGKLAFYSGILLLFPYLVGLKLGFLKNDQVKIKFISHFFKGIGIEKFTEMAKYFALQQIDKNLNPLVFKEFQNHLKREDTIFIVSASVPEWIEPWSKQFDVQVIGTILEVKNNKITGDFLSKNCYGIEKVRRINEILNLNDFSVIKVYGSGKGDLEMLQLSKAEV